MRISETCDREKGPSYLPDRIRRVSEKESQPWHVRIGDAAQHLKRLLGWLTARASRDGLIDPEIGDVVPV